MCHRASFSTLFVSQATLSSEEWEDRIQSDETTSSAYSSNSEVDTEERVQEENEDKAEYTTSNFHVINLLQPVSTKPVRDSLFSFVDPAQNIGYIVFLYSNVSVFTVVNGYIPL